MTGTNPVSPPRGDPDEHVRELARLATPALAPQPKRAIGRRLLAVSGVVAVLGSPVLVRPDALPADTAATAPAAAAAEPAAAAGELAVEADPVPAPVAFARYEDLDLVLPSEEVLAVAFHEAAYDDALGLTPAGRLAANENTTKFSPPSDGDGPPYVVLSSRGRRTPATSAVDIAVPAETPILSLVTGTVVDVDGYYLYGRYLDARLEIVPDERPDLRVVVIHVGDVLVAAGDRVVAGETMIALRATHFPFASQVDRHVPGPAGPHVHVEVKLGPDEATR